MTLLKVDLPFEYSILILFLVKKKIIGSKTKTHIFKNNRGGYKGIIFTQPSKLLVQGIQDVFGGI